MAIEQTLLVSIGGAVAKFLLRKYLGDAAGAVGGSLADVGTEKIKDYFKRREHAIKFEEISNAITKRLVLVFPEFEQVSAEAVILEVGKCVEAASITDLVLEENLSASDLERRLLRGHDIGRIGFSEVEASLYKKIISQLAIYVTQIASQLPLYNESLAKSTLARLSQIISNIDDLEQRIDDIAKRLPNRHSDFDSFELSYRLSVASTLDRAEIIGITIPPQLQVQNLSTSFVRLHLTSATTNVSRSARQLLDEVNSKKRRLLIRGEAGVGKSTLTKWIAIQSALQKDESLDRVQDVLFRIHASSLVQKDFNLKIARVDARPGTLTLADIKMQKAADQIIKFYRHRLAGEAIVRDWEGEVVQRATDRLGGSARRTPVTAAKESAVTKDQRLWQDRVPFLIRLRDCPHGEIPTISQWIAYTSKYAGEAPSGWTEEVLRSGRAIVIFDGVDEVPLFDRTDVRRRISDIVGMYPANIFIVTTRPTAVPTGWLVADDFVEAYVDPLTIDDRNELIRRWHKALELSGLYSNEELTDIARKLVAEIDTVPQIAQIAMNPLLCAMVCALNVDRKGQLPKNQRDLCSALLEALLHRRDAEQKIPLEGFPEDYGKLTLDQKRIMLRKIAYYMINNEISRVTRISCTTMIADSLSRFSRFSEGDAGKVLDLLIERTGVLRELSPGNVDFIHNTFKEFLAAEKFVEDDLYQPLVNKANDSQWSPVLFFAAASSDEKYVEKLLAALITFSRRVLESDFSDEFDEEAMKGVLALLKAYAVAISVSPVHRQEIQALKSKVLPPRRLEDVQLISSLGDEIVHDLPNEIPRDTEAAKAFARILTHIGTPAAKEKAQIFLRERRTPILVELMELLEPLKFDFIRTNLMSGARLPTHLAERIVSLGLDGILWKAKRLDFSEFGITDFSFLSGCTELETLALRHTKIFDGEPIGKCERLKVLNLGETFITDFSFLRRLRKLEVLDLSSTPIDSLDVLADLDLQYLNIWNTNVRGIKSGHFRNLKKISTNSHEVRRVVGQEKVMDRKQAERIFGRQTSVQT